MITLRTALLIYEGKRTFGVPDFSVGVVFYRATMLTYSAIAFLLLARTLLVCADNVETPDFITFTNPPPYNGSVRSNFTAGKSMNITWVPGSSGPSGLVSIRLLGGESNVTIAPDIASKGVRRNCG